MTRLTRTTLAAAVALIASTALADPAATTATTTTAAPAVSATQKQQIETVVHNYLIQHPEVLMEASDALQKQQMAKMEKAALATLPQISQAMFFDSHSPVLGNHDGKVSIVEFFDYQCPHCKDMEQALNDVVKQNPNVKIILKELPIFGETSNFASKAALAAQKQGKYQAFHNALFAQKGAFADSKQILDIAKNVGLNVAQLQKDMNSPEIQAELKSSFKLASTLGLSGTPAFVVLPTPDAATASNIDPAKASFLPGQVPVESIKSAIQKAQ